jgi:hypothetical protein
MRYAFALKGGHDQPAMLAVFFNLKSSTFNNHDP